MSKTRVLLTQACVEYFLLNEVCPVLLGCYFGILSALAGMFCMAQELSQSCDLLALCVPALLPFKCN